MIKKIKTLFLAAAVAATALTGCGGGGESSSIRMAELRDILYEAAPSLPDMMDVTIDEKGDTFVYVSDMDYSLVDKYLLSYSSEGLADEIVVVRMKKASDASAMESSLKEHRQDRINLYSTYSPDQVKRAESGLIFTKGNYAVLIICEEQNAVKEALEKAIGN